MSSRSNRQTIPNAFALLEAINKKHMFPSWRESRERIAIVPTCRTDFFDTSAKCGRVCCCKPTAGDQSDGLGANQIRTKSSDGANLEKFSGDNVVRSRSGTQKGIVLSLMEAVGSTHGANETQHRNRLDLDIAQSLNQALLVQALILITRCTKILPGAVQR